VSAPRVWLAGRHEAEHVARLLVEFRDHNGQSWPSDNAFLAGVERLMDDVSTDFLLGAPHDDAPPGGVVQMRYRFGLWRAGTDCLVEDVYVSEAARGAGLGRALIDFSIVRARERGARRVELDVNEANAAALALYGRTGFSATDNAYGQRDLYMRMHLDEGETTV